MTKRVNTHYDVLKVDRRAPAAVIRAAYKALSQIEHPDKNPGQEAVRRMSIINEAYNVLSNAESRSKHDAWISAQELSDQSLDCEKQTAGFAPAGSNLNPSTDEDTPESDPTSTFWRDLTPVLVLMTGVLLLGSVATLLSVQENNPVQDAAAHREMSVSTTASQILVSPTESDASLGPQDYPTDRAAKIVSDGNGRLSVTSPDGGPPFYCKLVISDTHVNVRSFYVPTAKSFELTNVPQGTYYIKCFDTDNAAASRTDEFIMRNDAKGAETELQNEESKLILNTRRIHREEF